MGQSHQDFMNAIAEAEKKATQKIEKTQQELQKKHDAQLLKQKNEYAEDQKKLTDQWQKSLQSKREAWKKEYQKSRQQAQEKAEALASQHLPVKESILDDALNFLKDRGSSSS